MSADTRPQPKTVLLAGATGYIGRAVAAQLVEAGYAVTAVLRSEAEVPSDIETVVTDLTDADALIQSLAGCHFDAVVSCIASRTGASDDAWLVDHDANQHLLSLAKTVDAKHFVLLSAICVQRPRLAFQHAKLAFEESLATSGLDYSIVRPTAYFRSLSGQIKRVLADKPFLVFGDGQLTACKPISESDLANFMVDCLTNPDARNRILPIGGPGDPITPREQGELLFRLTGKPEQFRRVPSSFLHWVAALLTPLGWFSRKMAVKAEFARIGHYYATESMLTWDEDANCYDGDATPSTGETTLQDHYETVLAEGIGVHAAGDQKLY
ncbi:MAG: NAD(P)H-binding protein [Woeseiaceae bacterium]